jgi:hypothetical protein
LNAWSTFNKAESPVNNDRLANKRGADHMPDPSVRSALTPGRARRRRLLGMSLIAALALFAGAFALGRPTAAQAGPAKAAAFAAPAATAIPRVARPGANLPRNSNGTAGDTSVQAPIPTQP